MNQLIFMYALEIVGTVGIFFAGPLIALAVYYFLAILRPQYLWTWALGWGTPWSDYPAAAAIVGAIGYSFGIIPITRQDRQPLAGFSPTHGIFFLWGAWTCVTYFTAYDQVIAWPWLQEYLTIFAMFAVSTIVVRTVEHAWVLFLAATAPLLYIAYHINSLYVFDGRLDIYHNGLGGLDNNGAGLMMAMVVPLALGAWEAVPRFWRWGFVAMIPLIIHAVLISYSRGAMVSLLAVIPLLFMRSRRKLQFAGVLVLLAAMVPFLAGNEIRARFFTIDNYTDDRAAQQRFGSWGAAIRMANDHPIFGVGIRNANTLSYRYGADVEGRTIHSQFLQLLADEGYVGLILYVLTLASLFVSGYRTRRLLKGRTDEHARKIFAMVGAVETSIAMFCVGGVFLSLEVFELPYLLILIGAQLFLIARREALAGVQKPVEVPMAAVPRMATAARASQPAR